MRTWRHRVVGLAGLALTAALGLAYGYLVSEWDLPPRATLERAREAARGVPALQRAARSVRETARRMASEPIENPPGAWSPARSPATDLSDHQREQIERLANLGYLVGEKPPPGPGGVTGYAPELASRGLNVFTSGHAPEAYVMDMAGKVLHRWSYRFADAFPALAGNATGSGTDYWRRLHPFPNGDLLAIYEGYGLIKLDRDSKLLWAAAGGYHHDLDVDERGFIYVLSRQARLIPRIHDREPILEDFVVVLDPAGQVVRSLSLLEAFERSSYAAMIERGPDYGDIFHTNTLELMDGSQAHRSPIFAKGNLLVSMRVLDAIAIVDAKTNAVRWALSGQWLHQHQPTLLANGRILLLDNEGHRGGSKVIEIDPFTQEIAWSYQGDEHNPFSTLTGGSVQRLRNGNTLVTESDGGRAFEVTSQRRVVWTYQNGARAGPRGEFVAKVFDVIRLPVDFFDWLSARAVAD